MPTVFVVHRNPDVDYSTAESFGELRFIHEGKIDKLDVPSLLRQTIMNMTSYREGDFLVPSGPTILNILATYEALHYSDSIKLLLWTRSGGYVVGEVA